MTCKHLKQLYEYCQSHNLRLSSTDLIRILCPQCGVEEECPSMLSQEYDAKDQEPENEEKSVDQSPPS
ncbi:MAG: hypothetical protein ACWGMZ_11210 [Thermoguttaceae bacterium]